jgi:mono/diheme cytochrome c family protein
MSEQIKRHLPRFSLEKLTRRRVALTTLAVLFVFDVSRSINARVGYASPIEAWQPSPAVYADLTWPPGANLAREVPLGARVYAQRCAVCHGPDGRGNGPAAPSMIPRPRDFTLGLFKYKSTPPGQPPTDEDLRQVVANGLPASAMPYFSDLLNDGEIRAVIDHIKHLSEAFRGSSAPLIAIPSPPPPTQASFDRGRTLYTTQGCTGCHGPDGRKGGFLQDAKAYPVPIRDLSAPWTFHGGSDRAQIWLRLTTGLTGSSMPAYAYALTPDERWDVATFTQSLGRVAPWEPGGQLAGRGQQADLLRRGEYLVHAEMCGLCHTQINRTGIYRGDDFYLAGGMRVTAYPHGVYVSRNLTSDRDTGLGTWTEGQIVNALRNGRAPSRLLSLWGMPWFFLHYLKDDDATAVARYLKTLPPVQNRIPAPLHYGVVETIASKMTRSLPAANPTVLTYADGNFGRADARALPASLQTLLARLQCGALIVGALAWIFAGAPQRRYPRSTGGWWVAIASVSGLLLLGIGGWTLYAFPTLGIIPPERIVSGATTGIPEPALANVRTPERKALIERGHYLFTVASCAFCHNPNGAGGQKISWRPFGTLWTRNITTDPRTGIGAWTDPQIARAIRSGVTPDGRVLHWQGMIWDHESNWDEEDVRSLVAYLRVLPPVVHEIPPSRPPAPDDCAIFTFWIATSAVPGCR